MSARKVPCCPRCGSDEVKLDALLAYDVASCEWVHHSDNDDMFCEGCDNSFKYDDLEWCDVRT